MVSLILVLLVVYCVSAVLIYAITFAYFQGMFPDLARQDLSVDRNVSRNMALIGGFAGPFAVATVWFVCDFGRFGLRLR